MRASNVTTAFPNLLSILLSLYQKQIIFFSMLIGGSAKIPQCPHTNCITCRILSWTPLPTCTVRKSDRKMYAQSSQQRGNYFTVCYKHVEIAESYFISFIRDGLTWLIYTVFKLYSCFFLIFG